MSLKVKITMPKLSARVCWLQSSGILKYSAILSLRLNKFHLICLSPFANPGKKNKLRVYYLSWLRNRILHNDPEVEKKQGWITVGDLEGCVHYKVGKDLYVCQKEKSNIPYSGDTCVMQPQCKHKQKKICYSIDYIKLQIKAPLETDFNCLSAFCLRFMLEVAVKPKIWTFCLFIFYQTTVVFWLCLPLHQMQEI